MGRYIKFNVSSKKLEEMYITKQMTCQKIANKYHVATSSVIRWLQIYNIPRRGQGTHRKIQLAGRVIGSWTIIKEVEPTKCGHARWLCRCRCGRELVKETNILQSKPNMVCAKCFGIKCRIKGRLTNVFWRQITYGAKKRGYKVSISSKTAYSLLKKQEWKCALSNLPITIADTVNEHQHGKTSASLDRINPTYGYKKSNIQWVHKDINRIKLMMDNVSFVKMCCEIYKQKNNTSQIISIELKPNKISNTMWNNISYSAKTRNIDFHINKDDAWNLYLQQGEKCALTGIPLYFPHSTYTWEKFNDGNVSLDRIDNNQSYNINNVQWIRKDLNNIKGKISQDRFKLLCELVAKKVGNI